MEPNLQLLDNRHEIPVEELSSYVSTSFNGNLLTLRQLEPFIAEIKRRFRTLPRNMGVDGKYKMIAGHRSFKSWCKGVVGRTDRCVRYMLAKAKNQEKKSKDKAETISVVLNRIVTYIKRQGENHPNAIDTQTEKLILEILTNRLKVEPKETEI